MRVVVDGIIYHMQSAGGISRIFNELLPRMCRRDESLEITLLTSRAARQSYPIHRRITPLELPSFRWWDSHARSRFQTLLARSAGLLWRLSVGDTVGLIWHSTYYTEPGPWKGPKVVTVYDMLPELSPTSCKTHSSEFFRQCKRRCILGADAIVCISNTTRDDLLRLYGENLSEKTYVMHLGCSDLFRVKSIPAGSLRVSFPTPFLLYVGSRAAYKNFAPMLEAYTAWKGRHEVALVAVGEPWTGEEQALLHRFGIDGRVYLVEYPDDEELSSLYNTALAYVHPSSYEGFGIPLLEAMACGCPILASRIPATKEIADNCPIYYDPLDREELLHAFDQVWQEGRDSQRVHQGLSRVKEFSWDQSARQLLQVYQAVGE